MSLHITNECHYETNIITDQRHNVTNVINDKRRKVKNVTNTINIIKRHNIYFC